MPLIQESSEKLFFENVHLQHPHHELFLRRRPYRGEPPTTAGFLLYPDTPVRMETTSREAFCFRPQRDKGHHTAQNTQQEPHPTSSRQTRQRNSRVRQLDKHKQEDHNHTPSPAVNSQQTAEMKSQYQKDFPPPSSSCRRQTPALPQPDNICINPAFRIEFSTVQREEYPGWVVMKPRHTGRMRLDSSRRENSDSGF